MNRENFPLDENIYRPESIQKIRSGTKTKKRSGASSIYVESEAEKLARMTEAERTAYFARKRAEEAKKNDLDEEEL
jgi:hypothetical protein